MGRSRIPKEEVNDSLSKRRENIVIPFDDPNELIKLVVEHLAYQYKKSLKDLKENEYEEYNRIAEQIPKFKESLTKLLKFRLKIFNVITIKSNSWILKMAFKMAKIKPFPQNSFRPNIKYKIIGLEFQIIKEYECS